MGRWLRRFGPYIAAEYFDDDPPSCEGGHISLVPQSFLVQYRTMTSSDAARHALYSQLEEILGTQNVDTLMAHLPRDNSDEVATKSDISRLEGRFDHLEERVDRLEERVGARFDQMYQVIIDQQRQYARTTMWSMTALTAIFSLVVTLFV